MKGQLRHINLYQAEFRPARVVFPASRMLAGLALLLLGLLALHGWGVWQNRELAAQVAQVNRQTEALETRLTSLGKAQDHATPDPALAADIQRLETRLAALARVEQAIQSGAVGSPGGWSAHFDALARVSVPGLWLTGVHLEGSAPYMTLRGRSLDGNAPARYIALLRQQPQFVGLEFAALEIAEPEQQPEQKPESAPPTTRHLEFTLSGPARPGAAAPPARQP
jgi:hypothetical protein